MDLFNSAMGKNITFVRPAYFKISGFIGLPNMKFYYVFLFFVYIISFLGNTAVMAVIYLDHSLRTPKYVVVFNLAFTDLLGSTALVPKVIDIFLLNHYYISYNDCLVFLFFCYTSLSMQVLNLVSLSCDRLVAIMFPLQYQVKVTYRSMFSMIACFWLFAILATLIAVGFITRLSFCKSVIIESFFCDHGQLYKLACNDNFPNSVIGKMLTYIMVWLPLIFIVSTYICIAYALLKVAVAKKRLKALKTCIAHLSLVAIYFIPILITFTMSSGIHPNARIINLSLTSVFPPMLNPIIYVLQTQEIKASIKKILKMNRKSVLRVK